MTTPITITLTARTTMTTIDKRIETAAALDDPIRALRDLADDVARESGCGADYDRVIEQIDTIRRDAEEAAS